MSKPSSLIVLILVLLSPTSAFAFDYLEHSYFTDLACHRAQKFLVEEITTSPHDASRDARFLALSLFCPTKWETDYCIEGEKISRSNLVTAESFPGTLGDLSAMPDHESRYGAIENLHRASTPGMVDHAIRWITGKKMGGVYYDIAEDACEYNIDVPWSRIEAEVDTTVGQVLRGERPITDIDLAEMARREPARGPADPPMKYSFDNPHYLDLVLRNHTHFGPEAFAAWKGFHSTANTIASRQCTALLTDRQVRFLGKGRPGWSDGSKKERRAIACDALGEALVKRVSMWTQGAPADWVAAVQPTLDVLATNDATALNALNAAFLAVVFEGEGLHFVQDILAGGHMRTIRSREALIEVRYDHDQDNKHGVVATIETRLGNARFVAFGDGYLLGEPSSTRFPVCGKEASRASRTDCLMAFQRGWIVAVSQTSLIDFVLREPSDDAQEFIDSFQPLEAPTVLHQEGRVGTLPVPQPPFSYESISIRMGFEPRQRAALLGVELQKLDEVDRPAHWMTSFDLGFLLKTGGVSDALTSDIAFSFHYRFYARVMLDMIPFFFAGIENLGGTEDDPVRGVFGVGPGVGFTVLPEGFTKIPLEAKLHAKLPITLLDTEEGWTDDRFRASWIQIGIGLAFMH